jgi:hypothetical protein
MRCADGFRFACLPLSERKFIVFAIVCIIVTRVAVILATPRAADFLDPRIYQGAGQAVLAGVNPYDFAAKQPLREKLRATMAAPGTETFTGTQESWDYYVSGNPPGSTALYAVFEAIAHGSRVVWRLLLILGDVALLLGLIALLRTVDVGVERVDTQLAVFCLTVVNPVLILSGCAIPEEKQFQTALMLYTSSLLLSAGAASARRALWSGVVFSLSVFFKVLGVFLLPLWLARVRQQGWRFALWSALGGLVPAAASLAAFGPSFLGTLAARGVQNSIRGAEHASPWVLSPLAGDAYVIAKTLLAALFCALLLGLLAKRRIDVLNFCAGITLTFVCLWLDKGAMNRMNIAIIFAVATLASVSRAWFTYFSVGLAALSAAAYAIGLGALRAHPEAVDALLVLVFVVAYLAVLVRLAFAKPEQAGRSWSHEPIRP